MSRKKSYQQQQQDYNRGQRDARMKSGQRSSDGDYIRGYNSVPRWY